MFMLPGIWAYIKCPSHKVSCFIYVRVYSFPNWPPFTKSHCDLSTKRLKLSVNTSIMSIPCNKLFRARSRTYHIYLSLCRLCMHIVKPYTPTWAWGLGPGSRNSICVFHMHVARKGCQLSCSVLRTKQLTQAVDTGEGGFINQVPWGLLIQS